MEMKLDVREVYVLGVLYMRKSFALLFLLFYTVFILRIVSQHFTPGFNLNKQVLEFFINFCHFNGCYTRQYVRLFCALGFENVY